MEFMMQILLPCLYAGAACVAFTFVFNIHGWGKLICGAGGALGWLVYLLCGQSIPAAFLAAVSISLFSEVMARVRRCPVTGYLLVALLPCARQAVFITQCVTAWPVRPRRFSICCCTLGDGLRPWLRVEFWHLRPSGARCCTCAACAGHRRRVRNRRTFSPAGRAEPAAAGEAGKAAFPDPARFCRVLNVLTGARQ